MVELENVFEWIRKMICIICLFQIFLQLIGEKKFRRYVKFLGSLVLTVMIFRPLVEGGTIWGNFLNNWQKNEIQQETQELLRLGEGLEELQQETIRESCKNVLKTQVEKMTETVGFLPVDTSIVLEEGDSFCVASMDLVVRRETESGDLDSLRENLKECYQISQEQITIRMLEE